MSDGQFGLICKAIPQIQSPGLTERAQASTGLPVWVTRVCKRCKNLRMCIPPTLRFSRARRAAAAEANAIMSCINYELWHDMNSTYGSLLRTQNGFSSRLPYSLSARRSPPPPRELTGLFIPLAMMMWMSWIVLAAANVDKTLWNEAVFHTVS